MAAQAIPTGLIGLGNMGAPMARNLARAGFLRTVWNRARVRAEAARAGAGVGIAPDPASLAAQCDVILLSVARDGDLLEVIHSPLPGLRAGAVIVDSSTVAVGTARKAAKMLARHDAHPL